MAGQIQGRDPSVDITQEVVESEDECPDGQATLGGLNSNSRAMMLPAAEIAHLGEIAKILQVHISALVVTAVVIQCKIC